MKKYLFLFFLSMLVFQAFSQSSRSKYDSLRRNYDKKMSILERSFTGGEFIFYITNRGTVLNLSPLYGIRPKNKTFSYGAGVTYQYTSYKYTNGSFYRYSLFGARVFARQLLGQSFFINGEAEIYTTRALNFITKKNEWIPIPFSTLYLGYKGTGGDFSYYYIMLGYNFVNDNNAQYVYFSTPIIVKAGIIIDLGGN